MDRRTLLKTVTGIAATAVVPTAAVAVAEATPIPPIVPPRIPSPYTDYIWQWFVSHDGESYYEAFKTKEEAIQYAKESEFSIVSECLCQDFDLSVHGWSIIETINDNNYELIGEGEGIECTPAQELDLEKMLKQTIEAWVVKHKIDLRAWTFADCKNTVEIPWEEKTS